jgi:hypothetical protein
VRDAVNSSLLASFASAIDTLRADLAGAKNVIEELRAQAAQDAQRVAVMTRDLHRASTDVVEATVALEQLRGEARDVREQATKVAALLTPSLLEFATAIRSDATKTLQRTSDDHSTTDPPLAILLDRAVAIDVAKTLRVFLGYRAGAEDGDAAASGSGGGSLRRHERKDTDASAEALSVAIKAIVDNERTTHAVLPPRLNSHIASGKAVDAADLQLQLSAARTEAGVRLEEAAAWYAHAMNLAATQELYAAECLRLTENLVGKTDEVHELHSRLREVSLATMHCKFPFVFLLQNLSLIIFSGRNCAFSENRSDHRPRPHAPSSGQFSHFPAPNNASSEQCRDSSR